jgi:membrane protease YdiL (CAAX protease family)
MRHGRVGYLLATRHPWSCLLFLIPLLLAYECGVIWLGGARPEALRNGADTWLRWGLERLGLTQFYCAPGLVIIVLLIWSWLRSDRPGDEPFRVWAGMALESIMFGLGLWKLSLAVGPFLDGLGIRLSLGRLSSNLPQIITFVGAGIYEEVLFRLVLFYLLGWIFWFMGLTPLVSAGLVAFISAVLFSAAHHIGPYGQNFNTYVFLFRTLAGLYFGLLYIFRGFGIAVGTHAFYDVLVGVLMHN